jgi:hypothetical protein
MINKPFLSKSLIAAILLSATLAPGASATAQAPVQIRDGAYLVNQQIPPGTYRSNGRGTRCYWKRSAESGDILNNHFGLAGGAVTIQPADYRFESRGCGGWTAVDPNNKAALPIEQQAAPKKDGFYLVGVDIAPGLWRSTGTGAGCYWARQTMTQDLLDNDFGYAGGAVLIRPDDFEFYTHDCGAWTMLDTANLPALPMEKQTAPKKDGVYIIGLNMAPGRWRSNGAGSRCYWAKATSAQELTDNHYGAASVIVEIAPTDFQFSAHGCGVWTLASGVGAPIDAGANAPQPSNAAGPACPSSDVCIVSPASGLRVARGNVVVFTGTANHPNFGRYQFQAGSGSNWGHLADFSKAVVNGVLMEFHTNSIPSGTYTIRLQVIDNVGNVSGDKAEVALTIY